MSHTGYHNLPIGVASFAHPARNVEALGIRPGMKVADFGAGSGAYTFEVAKLLRATGRVYAIDVQRDLLRRIANEAKRRGYENVEIIWADLEAPCASKLAENSIDLVLISNLLFQVPDKAPVLREARRIVKGTGHVVIIDWIDSFNGIGPIKDDVVTKEVALKIAEKSNLSLVREFFAGTHHYGLLFKPIALKI
ncbi:MAG: class I SAM-dependent methyltransferase [Patescibacteria group bacterium]